MTNFVKIAQIDFKPTEIFWMKSYAYKMHLTRFLKRVNELYPKKWTMEI